MPDRDLSEALRAKLSAELTSGAPLSAPLAAQARYATEAMSGAPHRHLRGRVLALTAAALMVLLAAAFAGPPQPRAWLVETVGNIAGDRATSSPSPVNQTGPATSPSASSHRSPSSTSAPEQRESPPSGESPGAQESPEPVESAGGGETSDGDGGQTSPTPSPSPGVGSGDH